MAYCANCGKEMSGAFCASCGASASGSPAPAPAASADGLAPNVASALCYLFGALTGVIFLVLAPHNQNPTVRFHAWQSILFTVAWVGFWILITILTGFLSFFALFLLPFELLLGFGGFLFWLFLMWKAYQGEKFVIPMIGPFAEQQARGA